MWLSDSLSVRCFLRSLCSKIHGSSLQRGRKRPQAPGWDPKAPRVARLPLQPSSCCSPSSLQERLPPACVLFPEEARLLPDSVFWTRNSSTLEYHPSFLSPMANFSCPSRPNPSNTISLKLFWNPSTLTICISTSPCFAYFTPLITQRAMIFFMSVSSCTRDHVFSVFFGDKNCDV